METTLSSSSTPFYKFVFPPVWILGFGYGTLRIWLQPGMIRVNGVDTPVTLSHQLLFLAGFVLGTGVILWLTVPLKRVIHTPQGLRISDYFSEIEVPLDRIVGIRKTTNTQPSSVTLTFRDETAFGTSVKFIPSDSFPAGQVDEGMSSDGFRAFFSTKGQTRTD